MLLLLASSLLCLGSVASPITGKVSSAGSEPYQGTFQNPSIHVRPKFRYWIPDASVDHTAVARDVLAAQKVGAGGLELLGYYLYGGPPSNGAGRGDGAPVDWAVYGFGTPAWHATFQAFAEACQNSSILMDFAMGPNQGTGVPGPVGSEGLSWDLVAYNISVPIGGSFNGTLPGWGTGQLQAAVTALTVKADNLTNALGPSLPGDLAANRTQITLSEASLKDVTDDITEDGSLSAEFDANATGLHNTIFAIYLVHSNYRAQDGPLDIKGPQSNPQSYINNGSWAVDHFSARGAKVMTDFWEQHILINGTRQLLMGVGNYGWEDSVEIESNVFWTEHLPDQFASDHGYSIAKWLPTLFHRNGHGAQSSPPVWYVTDAMDSGESRRADYRETLAKQYQQYLGALNSWAENYLNLKFSAQISYNMPMDMLSSIPTVDIPECESLDFSDLIDGYRQYSGPAHLAGRAVVSSECGAVRDEAVTQTLTELLWHVKRSYAGAINQFVFHGFPYSGPYGNTTWPGWTTFNYQYSMMHGPREPAWDFYRDQIDFVARNNFILQSGVPKVDIAVYQKFTTQPGHILFRTYAPSDLEKLGYTYEYFSPDNLALPAAVVRQGVLAPDAQAFKAMVIRANDSLTISGASKIADLANAGLPVIFAGGIPTTYLGFNNASRLTQSRQCLDSLKTLPNVHITETYEVASTVASIGIQPSTKILSKSGKGEWFTYWRSNDTRVSRADYVYVYNDAKDLAYGEGDTEGVIEFQSKGYPYSYDAWTGSQTPVVTYTQTNSTTQIPLRLTGNQSTIIAFLAAPLEPENYPSEILKNVSEGVLSASVVNGSINLFSGPAPGSQQRNTYTLANGTIVPIPVPQMLAITLSNWTLVAEHWTPPADLYNFTSGAVKYNTTHSLSDLVSWQDIPGLQNVSGRGYYSTEFDWPSAATAAGSGAFLSLPPVRHILRVALNGQALPPLDVTKPQADLTPHLVDGKNTLSLTIATPLGNVVRTIWNELESSGTGPTDPGANVALPPVVEYGVVGQVEVVPFIRVPM